MNPVYNSHSVFRQRILLLKWTLPLAIALLVIAYQLILARRIHDSLSDPAHFLVEVLFYATTIPFAAFWVLGRINDWLGEKEQAEKQAQVSERRLASITLASADAILSLDPQGHIESWNRGAELLFGHTTDEILGRPFADLLAGSESAAIEFQWLAQRAHEAGFIRGHETACRRADGSLVTVEVTATHIGDDEGNSLGLSVILRDVTSRKRREEEVRRLNVRLNEQVAGQTHELADKVEQLARANAELQKLDQMRAEFVSLVSHQIRAPLTNMKGATERMQTDCRAITPTCTRMFAIIDQQVARLDRLVRDVLSATFLDDNQMALQSEPISILPVIQQVANQIRARISDRVIRLPTKPGLPLVMADRDRVAEVLVNLIDNADKYSPAGEEITVDARADQTEVTLSVSDRGSGIPAKDLERVFDKFYRTDSSDAQAAYGYGLGLYVCRRLVEAQGGRIWVENLPDGGCTFSFTLPVWQGDDGKRDDPGH